MWGVIKARSTKPHLRPCDILDVVHVDGNGG